MDRVLDVVCCALYLPVSVVCHEFGHALAVILNDGVVISITTPLFWTANSSCFYGLPVTRYLNVVKCFVNIMGPLVGILVPTFLYKNHKPKTLITKGIRSTLFSRVVTGNLCDLLPVSIHGCHNDGYKIIENSIGANYTFNVSSCMYTTINSCLTVIGALLLNFRSTRSESF